MAGSVNLVEVPESSTGNSDSSPNLFLSSGAGSLILSCSSLGATRSSSHPEVLETNCQKMAENEIQLAKKLTEKKNSNGHMIYQRTIIVQSISRTKAGYCSNSIGKRCEGRKY